MSDKEIKEAVSCAIRHIGTGVYSSGKICFYLQNKGYDESVSLAAVKELVNTGYIDDNRASKKVLFTRSGKKQESRNYMLKRLLEAGIDPDIAEDVVAALPSDVDEESISANFKNGILSINMKKKAIATPKKIAIMAS